MNKPPEQKPPSDFFIYFYFLSQALSNPTGGDTESQRGLPLGPWLDWVPRALPLALTQPLSAGVLVHVCNQHRYGYMNVPVKSHQELEDERVNFVHLILEALGEGWEPGASLLPPLPASPRPLLLGPRPDWASGSGSQPHP